MARWDLELGDLEILVGDVACAIFFLFCRGFRVPSLLYMCICRRDGLGLLGSSPSTACIALMYIFNGMLPPYGVLPYLLGVLP